MCHNVTIVTMIGIVTMCHNVTIVTMIDIVTMSHNVTSTISSISSFQSHASRQDREFLSLNLVLRDENENFFYQSQTSRRERESRLRQFSREFSRITFIPCLMTDIFKKKAVIFSKFLKMLCPFFSRNLNKNLIFRDENGNFFSTSRVSRREREFFYSNLVFREGDENLKIISQGRARKN